MSVEEAGLPDGVSTPEDAFIERLRAGDPRAFDQLARREAPRVAGLLVSIIGPRNDLEDLVQTVFLEACRALPRFRGEGSISSYIGGIAVRVARRAIRPTPWTSRRSYQAPEPVANDNPERAAQQSAQLRRLHAALDRITPKKRIAFVLWALEGLEVEAIAELTSASVPATKSRIFYAQKELKRIAERDPHLRELLGGHHGSG